MFSHGGVINDDMPNKACSRQVGFAAFYRHFSDFGFILLSSVVSIPPTCG